MAPDREVRIAAQMIPTGIKRTLALSNPEIDIDGTDDVRVDADIAVIDTGIDYEHPDLNVVERTNCVPVAETGEFEECVDESGTDTNGHGTHVAGTAGAIDNGTGPVGVAPGARLWAVRTLNKAGWGEESWIVAAVDWVTQHAGQIEVANMSISCNCAMPPLDDAIEESTEAGVVFVVAAGNSHIDAKFASPASSPHVITVSALADYDGEAGEKSPPTCSDYGYDDTPASFSNYGKDVEVAAPGVCIFSTYKQGSYATFSGTSMASPHVAGATAILASEETLKTSKTSKPSEKGSGRKATSKAR